VINSRKLKNLIFNYLAYARHKKNDKKLININSVEYIYDLNNKNGQH